MKIILKSLAGIIRKHLLFFVLIVVCFFSSSCIMLFSFGVYQNYQLKSTDYLFSETTVPLTFSERQNDGTLVLYGVTHGEFQTFLEMLRESTLDTASVIAVSYQIADLQSVMGLYSRFVYRDGIYQPYDGYEKNLREQGQVVQGRFYTQEEYANGSKVVLAVESMLEADGSVLIGGERYEPIMVCNTVPDIPFTAVTDDTPVDFAAIYYDVPPNAGQVRDILSNAALVFGDRVLLPEADAISREQYFLYKTIILIAVLIAFIAAANLVILYHYIFMRRMHAISVFLLCGCTKRKCAALCSAEALVLFVPTFLLSAAVFHFILLPLLLQTMPYIADLYTPQLYLIAFAILVVVCTVGIRLLTYCMIQRKSVVTLLHTHTA